jgi:hypothetical protein
MDLGLFSSGELRAQEVRIFRLSPEGVHRQSALVGQETCIVMVTELQTKCRGRLSGSGLAGVDTRVDGTYASLNLVIWRAGTRSTTR